MFDFAFRLDANAQCGAGHFMRSLALIEIFSRLDYKMVVIGDLDDRYQITLETMGILYRPFISVPDCKCLVVDCYLELEQLLQQVNDQVCVVLFEDMDTRASQRPNIVINALGDRRRMENNYPQSEVFTGMEYLIFRYDVDRLKSSYKTVTAPSNIVVTLGASRQDEFLLRIIDALSLNNLANVTIDVFGVSGIDAVEWESRLTKSNSSIHFQAFDQGFFEVVKESCLVICAAGQTLLELAYCQIPVVGIVIADNQMRCGELLTSLGVSVVFDFNHEELISTFGYAMAGVSRPSVSAMSSSKNIVIDRILASIA